MLYFLLCLAHQLQLLQTFIFVAQLILNTFGDCLQNSIIIGRYALIQSFLVLSGKIKRRM